MRYIVQWYVYASLADTYESTEYKPENVNARYFQVQEKTKRFLIEW